MNILVFLILFVAYKCDAVIDLDFDAVEELDIINIFKERGIEGPEDIPAIKNWTDSCRSLVGESHWSRILAVPQKLNGCVTKYIKIKKVKNEIDDSMKRGELDLVFQKYCNRRPKIQKCMSRAIKNIEPCFDDDQMESLNLTKVAAEAALNFVCSDSGDKIALFIAEEGIECIRNRSDRLQTCLKEAMPQTEELEADIKAISIEDFMISEANCKRFFSVHDCIVNITTDCNDPTPSNILDSLWKQALNATPCARSGANNSVRIHCYLMLFLPYLLTLIIAGLTAAHILL